MGITVTVEAVEDGELRHFFACGEREFPGEIEISLIIVIHLPVLK